MLEQQIENKKLEKGSQIALIGSIILTVMTIVFGIISIVKFQNQFDTIYKEYLRKVTEQGVQPIGKDTLKTAVEVGVYVGVLIGLGFSALYTFLSWRLKKAKGKAIAITLIVLSSISVLFTFFTFVSNPLQILESVISLIVQGTILAGAVISLQANEEEYELNRLK